LIYYFLVAHYENYGKFKMKILKKWYTIPLKIKFLTKFYIQTIVKEIDIYDK
jgi:hypothetical protein